MTPEVKEKFPLGPETKDYQQLVSLLGSLYGVDRAEPLAEAFGDLCRQYAALRPGDLRELDEGTEVLWYQSPQNVGYIMYADLFAPEAATGRVLQEVRDNLGYLEELGVTLIHVLPALKSSGDAGFAVDDYREIDDRLGTMADFRDLTGEAHERGIRIVFDLVLNHTSDNHPWAQAAKNGDPFYRDFYLFSDRKEAWPAAPDIFPDHSPGWWEWVPELDQWVLSTFYKRRPNGETQENFPFAQWDLNYRNPEVLLAMMENLFFLANQGVDTFRLDAVPFLWKQEGTECQSLPEVHAILKLMRLGLKQVAPRATFLAEACQPPEQLAAYFGQGDEVQQAYHFSLMPTLWQALATGKVGGIMKVLERMPALPESAQWMIFTECHDEVSLQLGSASNETLYEFLAANGGIPFRSRGEGQIPEGISGTTYTLLGGDVRKIKLLWAVKMFLGGTPLIYMGEELGTENDLSYLQDPLTAPDSRFVKRIALTEEMKAARHLPGTKAAELFGALKELISWRKSHPALRGRPESVPTGNAAVLGCVAKSEAEGLVLLANFSDREQEASLPDGRIVVLQPYEFWHRNVETSFNN